MPRDSRIGDNAAVNPCFRHNAARALAVFACLAPACSASDASPASVPTDSGLEGAANGGSGGAIPDSAAGGAPGDAAPPVGTQCEVPPAPQLSNPAQNQVGTGAAGSCTLAALQAALPSGGTIDFNCGPDPVVIAVTETLVVKDGTHLVGHGKVTLDGGNTVRILQTESTSTVILEGLTFQKGRSVAMPSPENADGSGAAIYRGWQGILYVKDCRFLSNQASGEKGFGGGAIFAASSGKTTIVSSTFEQNTSKLGGAIHTILSDLSVVDCAFVSNEATDGDGGAVFTDGGIVPKDGALGAHDGLIGLCGSKFENNQATSSAGAGFLFTYRDEASGKADKLEIRRCEFRSNRVTTSVPGLGGAIRIDAVATISQSLFVDNQCAGQGGALWMGRGPATFENTTFFGNHADLWGGAISYGDKPITLLNCTLSHNTATEGIGCLFGEEGAATARNTLLVDNGEQGDNRHCSKPLLGERNMVFPATDKDVCGAAAEHADPLLEAALADHGGVTQTQAIKDGSPAIDKGTQCPSVDQRDKQRDPQKCDLGAFEK